MGKHPRLPGGLLQASIDSEAVESWWRQWPDSNVGLRTGVWADVLDLDSAQAVEEFEDLVRGAVGDPKLLPSVSTAKGRHFYFRPTGGGNRAGVQPGWDWRGRNGYVVAPPSLHAGGHLYEWLVPVAGEPPTAPGFVLQLLNQRSRTEVPAREPIPEGKRNAALASLAGSMRHRGMSQGAIEAALLAENRSRCQPPLGDDEVRQIAASMGRYPPAAGGAGQAGDAEPAARPESDDDPGAPIGGGGAGAPSQARALIELARTDFRLGRTYEGQTFAVPLAGPNVARVLRGGPQSLRAELARRRFEITDRVPSQSALTDALVVLEGQASVAEPGALPLRVAQHQAGIVLDLGRPDGLCVVVTTEGWSVASRSPVTFERTALTQQLPVPVSGGSLDALWPLVNVSADDRPLVLAWEVTALLPDLPCPLLFLRGFQGTAKTETARLLTCLIDPSPSAVAGKPRDPEQWSLTARAMRTFTLDNLSSIPEWLSDALCRAVTGDAYVRRSLYENREVQALSFQRAIILTAIDAGSLHGDLAERVVGVELEQITPDRRLLLTEVRDRFRAEHPRLLGTLLDLLVKVLAERGRVPADRLARMADFDLMLRAVDRVCGSEGRARYAGQSADLAREVLEGDAVAQAILNGPRALAPGEVVTDTPTELLHRFTPNPAPPRFPSLPQHFTGRLRRLAPSLQAAGVTFASGREGGKDRIRQVTLTRGTEDAQVETAEKSSSAASTASIRSQEADTQRPVADAEWAQSDAQLADQAASDAQSPSRTLVGRSSDAHSPRSPRSQADAADDDSSLLNTKKEERGEMAAATPVRSRQPGRPLPDDGQPCPACGSTARRVAPTQQGQATFCATCNPGPGAGKQA